jgi:Raf kinase inhibitor-like YbhB/YbcL family protein
MQGIYPEGNVMTLTLASTAFTDQEPIPQKYTCEGEDVSPPLEWAGVPEEAQSLVLIVDDPDAPDPEAPQMVYVHWVLYNLPPDTPGLPENVTSADLPEGTLEGKNDWKRTGYGGPCPPIGRHRYFHKLYALNTRLLDMNNPTKSQLLEVMEPYIIAEVELIGTYQKEN